MRIFYCVHVVSFLFVMCSCPVRFRWLRVCGLSPGYAAHTWSWFSSQDKFIKHCLSYKEKAVHFLFRHNQHCSFLTHVPSSEANSPSAPQEIHIFFVSRTPITLKVRHPRCVRTIIQRI
jgi:hypothetical protein